MPIENNYKVRLMPANVLAGDKASRGLSFDASPNVSESRTVNYNSLEPLHAPGQIQVYKNTQSRTFQISDIKLISRTVGEATQNLEKLWALRSWCMPRFGNSSTLSTENRLVRETKLQEEARRRDPSLKNKLGEGNRYTTEELGSELLGAPPPIILLSAYSKIIGTSDDSTAAVQSRIVTTRWNIAQHINRVPTVIQQLTIPYPNDVDYITTSNGVPMPLIMNIDITLLETHSPNAYEGFNLNAFREGRLQGY